MNQPFVAVCGGWNLRKLQRVKNEANLLSFGIHFSIVFVCSSLRTKKKFSIAELTTNESRKSDEMNQQ